MAEFSILSDATVSSNGDQLAFHRYVKPLVSILTDPSAETPFTIGVFGTWGCGKSTLLKMVDEKLQAQYQDQFVRVHFNPWIYRNEDNMLIPLLHALQDTLKEDPQQRFLGTVQKLGNVMLRLGADWVLKRFTSDAISLEKVEELAQKYSTKRGEVESETRKLRETLQKEAHEIAKQNARLIFFIDDLDRCEPDEIIGLLESIKLFLDLKNVFVILAVDKEIIDRGVEVKYAKFEFSRSRKLALGAEYLEKMVQLPLQLYPLRTEQVRKFMEAFSPSEAIQSHFDLLQSVLIPNPRKIKRILNILAVSADIIEHTPGLKQLKPDLLVRLAVLQVQAGDLYSQIVSLPELLVALEGLNAKPPLLNLKDPGSFTQFGSRRDAVIELCNQYHRPDTYLSSLFRDSTFATIKREDLSIYLSMLGA